MTTLHIEIGTLSKAAVAVHDLLSKHKLTYAFFGGFELVLLNQPGRTTKDIDVEIVKPRSLFGGSGASGFEKVKAIFKSDEIFFVFDGTKDDALRVIWNKTVGIDVFMREGRMPRSTVNLPVTLPHDSATDSTPEPRSLPFFKPTDLLVEKVRSMGERNKRVDATDTTWIYNDLALQQGRADLAKANKRLGSEEVEAAKKNFPHMCDILDAITAA